MLRNVHEPKRTNGWGEALPIAKFEWNGRCILTKTVYLHRIIWICSNISKMSMFSHTSRPSFGKYIIFGALSHNPPCSDSWILFSVIWMIVSQLAFEFLLCLARVYRWTSCRIISSESGRILGLDPTYADLIVFVFHGIFRLILSAICSRWTIWNRPSNSSRWANTWPAIFAATSRRSSCAVVSTNCTTNCFWSSSPTVNSSTYSSRPLTKNRWMFGQYSSGRLIKSRWDRALLVSLTDWFQ